MNRKTEIFEAEISPAAIDEAAQKVRQFICGLKLANRDAARYSMSVEEILLKYLDKNDAPQKFQLKTGYRFFRPFISVHIEGQSHNVYLSDEDTKSVMGEAILKNLGLAPEYSFSSKLNNYNFRVRKKQLNPFMVLMISLILAVTCGFFGTLLPDTFRTFALNNILSPLHDTFLNVLGCIAGPMIFLSVAWGIYGIGDAATLKQIGKKLLTQYVGTVYVATIVVGMLAFPLFSLKFSSGSADTSGVSAIFDMILNIFPKNIFSPFVDGNTLQIIFLAIVIGIAMLFLGQKTNAVAKAVEQINYIVQFLIEFISKLVPYFIFIAVVKMIWSDMEPLLLSVGKLFAIFICAALLFIILCTLYTALSVHCSPVTIVKKGFSTFIIALTTASSAAAFGTSMKACTKGYGIDSKITSFGIPLGIVTFKPITSLSYMIMSLFFAECYNVEISVSWILVLLFTSGILAIATPPIPGGALTAYTVLFMQLGIPAEAIAIALAVDTLFDFIDTGCDQFLLPLAILRSTDKLGLVDRKILKKK